MKYLAAVSTLALAATAAAVPTEMEARTDGGGHGGRGGGGSGGGSGGSTTCSASGQRQVCCSGILGCVVQILSANCNNNAYCCNTSAATGTLVNVQALNCVKIL